MQTALDTGSLYNDLLGCFREDAEGLMVVMQAGIRHGEWRPGIK